MVVGALRIVVRFRQITLLLRCSRIWAGSLSESDGDSGAMASLLAEVRCIVCPQPKLIGLATGTHPRNDHDTGRCPRKFSGKYACRRRIANPEMGRAPPRHVAVPSRRIFAITPRGRYDRDDGRAPSYWDAADLVVADGKLPDGTGMDVSDAATEKGVKCIIIAGYAFTLPVGAVSVTRFSSSHLAGRNRSRSRSGSSRLSLWCPV